MAVFTFSNLKLLISEKNVKIWGSLVKKHKTMKGVKAMAA